MKRLQKKVRSIFGWKASWLGFGCKDSLVYDIEIVEMESSQDEDHFNYQVAAVRVINVERFGGRLLSNLVFD